MTKRLELYKCNICGNLVQVLVSGMGELVCCGEKMHLMTPNNDINDELNEKHSPHIHTEDGITTVMIQNHPMINEHYIMFLQCVDSENKEIYTRFLNPNEEIKFELIGKNINKAYSYCNINGLYNDSNRDIQEL